MYEATLQFDWLCYYISPSPPWVELYISCPVIGQLRCTVDFLGTILLLVCMAGVRACRRQWTQQLWPRYEQISPAYFTPQYQEMIYNEQYIYTHVWKNTEVLRYISFLSFFYKSQVFRPAAHQGQHRPSINSKVLQLWHNKIFICYSTQNTGGTLLPPSLSRLRVHSSWGVAGNDIKRCTIIHSVQISSRCFAVFPFFSVCVHI